MLPRKLLIACSFCAAFGLAGSGLGDAWAQQTQRAQTKSKAPSQKKAVRKTTKSAPEDGKAEAAAVQKKLDAAASALAANKTDDALRGINDVLTGSRVDSKYIARALYLRGQAYRKQGKPAQAMADFSSAIYIKGGLSDAERSAASTARAEAAREVGIADVAGESSPPTLTAGPAPAARPAPSATTSGWQTGTATRTRTVQTEAPAAAPGGSGIGDFFSGLFGGGSNAPAPPSTTPRSAAPARTATAPAQPSVGQSWSSATKVKDASNRGKSASAAPAGRYLLQIGSVRSRKEAQALAAKARASHAAISKRQPQINETVIGNMGTFYQVRFGPFADASEPKSLCDRMRSGGYDCMVTTQ